MDPKQKDPQYKDPKIGPPNSWKLAPLHWPEHLAEENPVEEESCVRQDPSGPAWGKTVPSGLW